MGAVKQEVIEIDGSYGEGGGQILRTALALSAILKKPFTIHRIRSRRKNPGLQAQHLEAVEALARITEAQTEGVKFGSQKSTFIPQKIVPGDYQIEVRTSRSVQLFYFRRFSCLLPIWRNFKGDSNRRYPCPMEPIVPLSLRGFLAYSPMDGSFRRHCH